MVRAGRCANTETSRLWLSPLSETYECRCYRFAGGGSKNFSASSLEIFCSRGLARVCDGFCSAKMLTQLFPCLRYPLLQCHSVPWTQLLAGWPPMPVKMLTQPFPCLRYPLLQYHSVPWTQLFAGWPGNLCAHPGNANRSAKRAVRIICHIIVLHHIRKKSIAMRSI